MLAIILAFEAAVENRAAQATQRSPLQTRHCDKHFSVIVADFSVIVADISVIVADII